MIGSASAADSQSHHLGHRRGGIDWKHTEYRIAQTVEPTFAPTFWDHLNDVLIVWGKRLYRCFLFMSRETNMAWYGLKGGLGSIGYIVMLLLLVMYIYAVVGVNYFAQNDPFHFGSIDVAMLTLTRVVILDAWTMILYINYYGCKTYPASFYYNDVNDIDDGAAAVLGDQGAMAECNDNPLPAFTVFFFVTYIFIASFCILALIIGAVGMRMVDSMAELKAEESHRNEEEIANYMVSSGPKDRKTRKALQYLSLALNGQRLSLKTNRGLTIRMLLKVWFSNEYEKAMNELRSKMNGYSWDYRSLYRVTCDTCAAIADDSSFSSFITVVILYVSLMSGLQTLPAVEASYDPVSGPVELTITLIFTFECFVKIMSEDEGHHLFFKDTWNLLDLLVVIFSWGEFLPSNLVMLVRLIRLLRVLKIMRALPELQNMAEAMFDGIINVLSIAILLFAYLFFASLIGNALFGQNDPNRFGNITIGMITMFQCATFDAWADAVYTSAYGCAVYGYNEWECEPEDHNPRFIAANIYFSTNLVIGGLVMLTLFVGVMSISLEDKHSALAANIESEKELKILANKFDLSDIDVGKYRRIFNFIDISGSSKIEEIELKVAIRLACVDEEHHLKLWRMIRRREEDDYIDFATFLKYMMLLREEYLHKKYGIWHPVNFGDSDSDDSDTETEHAGKRSHTEDGIELVRGGVELSPAMRLKNALGQN